MHAEKPNLPPRRDVLRGQLSYRDVEVAAEKRGQQQQNRGERTEPEVHVSKTQGTHLDPDDQYDEEHDQQRKVGEGEGKILKLAQLHARSSRPARDVPASGFNQQKPSL